MENNARIAFGELETQLSKSFGVNVTIKGIKLMGETRLREGEELEQMRNNYVKRTEQL